MTSNSFLPSIYHKHTAVIDDDVEALSNLRSEGDVLARRNSSPTTTSPSSACTIAAGTVGS